MGMTLTIRVDYEGKNEMRDDLSVQEKFPMEQIRDCKFDLVCHTIYKLVGMINKARTEKEYARHSGENT